MRDHDTIFFMKDHITILDGGMGREIKRRTPNFDPILWSAGGLIQNPTLVKDIHKEFILAGAEVITTNNYTVVPKILKDKQIFNQFESLTKKSVQLVTEAKKETNQPQIKITGSMPPLESSYRPDLVRSFDEAYPIYCQIAEWLIDGIDIFLCESMSSIAEATAAVSACQDKNKPIWVAFLLDDNEPEKLLSGEPVEQVNTFANKFNIDAVLFNCCHPASVTIGLKKLHIPHIKKGAYANAFQKLSQHKKHMHGDLRPDNHEVTIASYQKSAEEWIHHGASIIGGCCGIGPEFIKELSNLKTTFKK